MAAKTFSPGDRAATAIPSGAERFPVMDRKSWLAMREKDVTASTAGCLLGAHDYMTAYQLWALKSGLIAEDPEETPPMRRGRLLEPIALEVLREERPTWRIEPCGFYYRDPAARIGCTPDAFAIDPELPGFGVVQVKSVESGIFRSKWRTEDGAVEPPLYIAVQTIVEAVLTGASWALVLPLMAGHGLEIQPCEVPMHAGIMDRLRNEVDAFWRSVEAGQPPEPDFARDGATIAGLYPEDNGQEIDLTADNRLPEIAAERDRLKSEIKVAAEAVDRIDAEFKHRLGPNEAALIAGGRRVTWRTQSRAMRFQPPSESRVLRISRAQ